MSKDKKTAGQELEKELTYKKRNFYEVSDDEKIKKAYDKKVRPHTYQEGDLVVKKLLPAQKDKIGKWAANYEGPFVVKRAFSGGALILTNMDGEELRHPINSDAVKKYYA